MLGLRRHLTFDTMIYFREKASRTTTVPNWFENVQSDLSVKMWRNALVRAHEQGQSPKPFRRLSKLSLFFSVTVIRGSVVISVSG